MRTTLASMPARGRAVLAALALGIVVVAFLLLRLAGAPSYTTLQSGLDPAQTGKMTAALDEAAVPYELQNNGTALGVEKAKVAQARIALASKGLLAGGGSAGQPGFELFDKQKLGASNFQQQVTYQRALEGQIANTLNQIDGVGGAQVSLVMPQEQIFADEQKPASAAVLLGSAGTGIDPAAVRGMAQLVASSVPGLKPSGVTITDASGSALWPAGPGGEAGEAGSAAQKQAAESRYSQATQGSLQAMLDRTLGPGKAQVQVHADLNVDRARTEELTYAKRGVPLRTRKETERLRGGGGARGGAGTPANVPSYAQAGGAGGSSDYRRENGETDFGVDKKVTRTDIAPGAVNKLDVALVVDSAVPPASVAQLRAAVGSAAGVTPRRGDRLSVATVAFAKPPAPPRASPVAGALGAAKYVGLALAAAAFLFFVARHLRRREGEALAGEPTWLREVQAPTPLAELEHTGQLGLPAAAPASADSRAEVEELLQRSPETVASQVKAWMNEE